VGASLHLRWWKHPLTVAYSRPNAVSSHQFWSPHPSSRLRSHLRLSARQTHRPASRPISRLVPTLSVLTSRMSSSSPVHPSNVIAALSAPRLYCLQPQKSSHNHRWFPPRIRAHLPLHSCHSRSPRTSRNVKPFASSLTLVPSAFRFSRPSPSTSKTDAHSPRSSIANTHTSSPSPTFTLSSLYVSHTAEPHPSHISSDRPSSDQRFPPLLIAPWSRPGPPSKNKFFSSRDSSARTSQRR
jgi:hypothetical protein